MHEPPVANSALDRLRPMLLMLLATVAFASMHGSIRHVAQNLHLHPFEIAFFRNLVGLAILSSLLLRAGFSPFRTSRLGLHLVRGGINAVAMLTFFYAVAITPLAEVAALSFTAPLFATILAMVFLGEVVRLRRWSALITGFVGMLIILRPGIETAAPGSLLIVASSACWAAALVVIKVLARTDSSVTITAYMALVLTPLTLIPALFVWQWPNLEQLLWLIWIGVAGTIAQVTMAEAMRGADATALFPIDFTRLIWAALIGWLAFAEVPDIWVWIGGGVIFASTTYIAVREARLRRGTGG